VVLYVQILVLETELFFVTELNSQAGCSRSCLILHASIALHWATLSVTRLMNSRVTPLEQQSYKAIFFWFRVLMGVILTPHGAQMSDNLLSWFIFLIAAISLTGLLVFAARVSVCNSWEFHKNKLIIKSATNNDNFYFVLCNFVPIIYTHCSTTGTGTCLLSTWYKTGYTQFEFKPIAATNLPVLRVLFFFRVQRKRTKTDKTVLGIN